jgi:hypothetical protein
MGIAVLMTLTLGLHVGGQDLLKIGIYSPLLGAFIGGTLVLISVSIPFRQEEDAEPWLGREKLAWVLIGCGCIGWGIGESFWRYYVANGQSPFPSLADFGYTTFSPLVFLGLILLPSSASKAHKHKFLLLDCLIATGALLSIAWFLLLGSLAQSPAASPLAKFLGLYYPTTDVALLSCITFLLLRGENQAGLTAPRRISLLIVGLGLSIFAASDFLFNILLNLGVPVDGSWVDLGWPLGIMTVGVAAYLRRFLPHGMTKSLPAKQERENIEQIGFGPSQAVPYLLLLVLFLVLSINVVSPDPIQQSIRPVLIIAAFIVIGLLIVRQIITIQENSYLMRIQVTTLKELEQVYQDVAKRNATLETGVTYLKEVQTRLANGDVRARAQIMDGELWPLATGLNLMADRMMRSDQNQRYAQKILNAIGDLCLALEKKKSNMPLVLPPSCLETLPELQRLLLILGLRSEPEAPPQPSTPSYHGQQMTQWRQTQLRNR